MSRNRPKDLPVIPVVGGRVTGAGGDREEQLRKWEEEQAQKRAAEQTTQNATPAVAPVPAPTTPASPPAASVPTASTTLPDPTLDPTDQLVVCERGIHEAKARWKAKVDGATEEFIAEAGPLLCWVQENKLHKLMLNNSGKPYRSFRKYLKEQHDLSPRTGYRITQTVPLLNLLRTSGYMLDDLSSRQVAVLHPVRLQHGPDAVLKVWSTASGTKKGPQPTPEELEKAKHLLGLSTKPDQDEEQEALPPGAADAGVAVERAAKLLVPETVREAVRKDPDRVRLLYRVLGSALSEAGVTVD